MLVDLDGSLPRSLRDDPGRLAQVFMNLIGNAVKFTSKGHVVIRGKLVKNTDGIARLKFEIQDTGIGISTAGIAKMFKAFSQADASTSRRFGGTGLGLSISKKLVETMNGQIGVDSAEGTGSTFWFEIELPVSSRNLAKSPMNSGSFKGIQAEKTIRVLVAEDNSVNQLIAVKMLQKMGMHAHVAGNGKEALEMLRDVPYDLVLMDCQMPEIDGYEATRAIRSGVDILNPSITIFAMTANAMSGDAEKCLASGMNGYISKPVSFDKLQEIIFNWIGKPVSKVA